MIVFITGSFVCFFGFLRLISLFVFRTVVLAVVLAVVFAVAFAGVVSATASMATAFRFMDDRICLRVKCDRHARWWTNTFLQIGHLMPSISIEHWIASPVDGFRSIFLDAIGSSMGTIFLIAIGSSLGKPFFLVPGLFDDPIASDIAFFLAATSTGALGISFLPSSVGGAFGTLIVWYLMPCSCSKCGCKSSILSWNDSPHNWQ